MIVDINAQNLVISVITVSYNSSDTIAKTMQSVLSQNYQEIEYIIVDGGSTDNTHEIIRSNMDERVRLIIESDAGIYDAMNKGFALATGDIIYFLNCGDYLSDDTVIEKICSILKSEHDIDAVYGDIILYDDYNKNLVQIERITPFHVMTRCGICHQAIFVKKNSFYNTKPFNINYKIYADYDWLLNGICDHNYRLCYLNVPVVYYKAGGISQQARDRRFFTERLILIHKYFTRVFNRDIIIKHPLELLIFVVIYTHLLLRYIKFLTHKEIVLRFSRT